MTQTLVKHLCNLALATSAFGCFLALACEDTPEQPMGTWTFIAIKVVAVLAAYGIYKLAKHWISKGIIRTEEEGKPW